jgi:hypothetical protein
MESLQSKASQQLEAVQSRHSEELTLLLNQLYSQLPSAPKPSSDLLNYRKILEGLIKRKDYAEAAKVQDKIDGLERSELRTWEKARRLRIKVAESQLIQRQALEIAALKKRMQALENEHIKRRETQHEMLLQRYQNTLKSLESERNQAIIRMPSPTKSLASN